ncbi:hypothetical protein ZIOFF_019659 [Zingiber officinale]|uniref:FLZ-type domain-containing protein n=1 Tax=Zingiber officinale TaxID=94328 RepID=A0A8J5H7Q0_ZINOF|nr:hypothetical protein ZIOFF_019659 [Zingiber officinale]
MDRVIFYLGDEGGVDGEAGKKIVSIRVPEGGLEGLRIVIRNGGKRSNATTSMLVRPPGELGFLESCCLCRRELDPCKDVYMYRGRRQDPQGSLVFSSARGSLEQQLLVRLSRIALLSFSGACIPPLPSTDDVSRRELHGSFPLFSSATVACLSLPAKMDEAFLPSLLDLQVEGAKFIFEPSSNSQNGASSSWCIGLTEEGIANCYHSLENVIINRSRRPSNILTSIDIDQRTSSSSSSPNKRRKLKNNCLWVGSAKESL